MAYHKSTGMLLNLLQTPASLQVCCQKWKHCHFNHACQHTRVKNAGHLPENLRKSELKENSLTDIITVMSDTVQLISGSFINQESLLSLRTGWFIKLMLNTKMCLLLHSCCFLFCCHIVYITQMAPILTAGDWFAFQLDSWLCLIELVIKIGPCSRCD